MGSFEYSPASTKYPTLFELTRPLDDLEDMLCAEFAGQTLSMLNVYERHNIGRPYVKANYKSALIRMEAAGSIKADPLVEKRPKKTGKTTFGDDVIVTFRGDKK